MTQLHSSKETSVNVVNKVYTRYEFKPGSRIFDYGGGKYLTNTKYMAAKNVHVSVYDKYNKSPEDNAKVLKAFREKRPDYIVCSNVLCVIMENAVIDEICADIASYADENTIIIFSVYEGDRSGIGHVTSKGYQRNQKRKEYVPFISKYFEITGIDANTLVCKRRTICD